MKMFEWLISNMGSILVFIIVSLIIGLALMSVLKKKKKGKSSCGCGGCDGCCSNCHNH